jgi:integrase/recombinase XerD
LTEYAPVFLKWLGFVRQRRENTVRSYGEDLKTFLAFCEQAELSKPEDVSFRHLEFYLGWLQTERGLKATSANRHVYALRTFWKWMVHEEITTRNPAADVFLLPTQRKLPRYLTIPEQEKLLAALAQDPSLLGRRDDALVATGLLTGLRCVEVQVPELEMGQKDRELPVIPRLEAILRRYLGETRPQLVHRPFGKIRPPGPRGKYWHVIRTVGRTTRTSRATSREKAERLQRALIPVPPDPSSSSGRITGG